jgi:hypothetical protein
LYFVPHHRFSFSLPGEFDLKTTAPPSDNASDYKSSCTEFPVIEDTYFRKIEIEFEVFPNIRAQYIANNQAIYATQNSNIDLGLGIQEDTDLRNSQNSISIKLKLTRFYRKQCKREWHLHVWKKGHLMKNVTFTETLQQLQPLRFLFKIVYKRIHLSVYNGHIQGFSDIEVFRNFQIKSSIYLCVGIEPSVLPTKILYSVKKYEL